MSKEQIELQEAAKAYKAALAAEAEADRVFAEAGRHKQDVGLIAERACIEKQNAKSRLINAAHAFALAEDTETR